MSTQDDTTNTAEPEIKPGRRDFLYIATGTVAAFGAGAVMWPLIDSLNPSAATRALSTVEFDLSPVEFGQRVTFKWQGQPIFVVRRTPKMIDKAKIDDANMDLIDPATDASRAQNPEWLIVIGICTHLGCVPKGQKEGEIRGKWGGWFCVCHGSIYDIAGRVRRGPAPRNLDLPPYEFLDNGIVKVG
jgi:ubiquinol-cytochrome c reductase iron-sulfur subunit